MLPVYVLSLRRNQARRREIKNHLGELGISFEWIDGVDGRKLSAPEKSDFLSDDRQYFANGPMSDGALGCLLSHRLAWQRIVSSSESTALILEDDAVLQPETKDALSRIERLAGKFDMIHLHHTTKRPLFGRFEISETQSLSLHKYNPIQNVAYVISRNACEKLLDLSLPAVFEVDLLCQRWWEHGLATLTVDPPLATEIGGTSTIGYPSTPPVWQNDTIRHKLGRYFNRRKASVTKRYLFRRMSTDVMSRLARD